MSGPAGAADIGVLADGRQVEYLSLLGSSSSEARLALEQDGHGIVVLPSLEPLVLSQVHVVWLPLLDASASYTVQERLDVLQYLINGGAVIWIGDADVYNTGDNSFLAAFGMAKLVGNLNPGLEPAPTQASHPVVTGPHGSVALIAADAGYGLFDSAADVADVFVGVNEEDPPQTGTFAGLLDPGSGFCAAGRVAFICDASIFGQNLDQDGQDHRAFLRNIAKWAEAAPGYTPSGTDVVVGDLPSACGACTAVQLVFETVTVTGETSAFPTGSGRCGFDGIAQSALPAGFLGYGFTVETTATFPDPTNVGIIVTYDEAELASLGIDEADLRLFRYDAGPGSSADITSSLDTVANAITGSATGVGQFLLGAIVATDDCNDNAVPDECDVDVTDPDGDGMVSEDCNDNGVPDECEIDENSTAPGGPFFCTADCAPDCNGNGVPDSCDIAGDHSEDCNDNTIPDECEIDENSAAAGGPFFCTADCDPDCNDNGIPDRCDIASDQSQDCNENTIPDECETGIAPEISQQPTDQSVCEGGAVTFTVVADGFAPLAYQWRKDGVDIQGATDAEYTIDPVTTADVGGYNVTITNPCGSITSEAAALVVHEGPTISEQPEDRDVCEGEAAWFAVVAAGTGSLGYQWYKDGELLVDDGPISGAATGALQIEPVDAEHVGEYRCTVADECGSVSSETASLVVRLAPQITEQPVDQSACPDDEATFTVVATGTELTYQWQHDDGGGYQDLVDGANVGGSTTATLAITDVTAAASGLYHCVISGRGGAPITTDAAELTVWTAVQIDTHPVAEQSACAGDAVSFAVAATGTELTYQWQFNSGTGYHVLEDGDGVSGASADTLAIAAVAAAHAGTYRCVVAGRCGNPVTSQTATLTVGAPPEIVTEPQPEQWVCPGEQVTFSIAAMGTELTYQWQFDGGGGFADIVDGVDVAGSTTNVLSVGNLTEAATGQYRCLVSGRCGAPATSSSATLTIGAVLAIETHPVDRSACPTTQVVFTVATTGSGVTYQWQFNGGPAFEDLTEGSGVSGTTTSVLTVSDVGDEQAGAYRCIVHGACGPPVTTNAAMLTVTVGACDCNENGQLDADDIAAGTSQDCNHNGIPDDCDIDPADPDGDGVVSQDCNHNGIPDECDIDPADPDGDGVVNQDCNGNGVPDTCDMAVETSQDCNGDSVPDECQLDGNDCNHNGVPDECDPPYLADAGGPFTICTGQASRPLGGNPVAVGSTPPYTFLWHVVSGPAGGTILDPAGEHTRFIATLEGTYEIELVVSDSNRPPCVTTDTVLVTARTMSAHAGEPFAICLGATSAALSPDVTGGVEPYTYAWTIDEGSPSTFLDQFTGGGPRIANPTFTPEAPGRYILHMTVRDANDPSGVATDTLTVDVMQLGIKPPDDFAMCVSGESDPLVVTITAPGTQPLSYTWSIDDGSPNTNVSQFTGPGPNASSPTFSPTSLGAYVLRVTVRDSSTPPCEQTATVRVTAVALTVDAGGEQTLCVGRRGVRLSPSVEGGAGEMTYVWSIEPGSPSVDPSQFSDPHNFDASPLFTPSSTGNYTLRLTVTDSGSPPCTAGDSITVRATTMTVDAGEDFTTEAFRSSRRLGAIPVAGGGDEPLSYVWEIVSGPSRDPSQLSATDVEHPLFTPDTVGTYEIRVTVSDANGAGCAIGDTVLVEAIASRLSLPVNVEGRLFMALQIDAPHTRGEIRISDGAAGQNVTGELYEDGTAARSDGLAATPDLSRRMLAASEMKPGSYVAVVVMYYGEAELDSMDENELRLHRFNAEQQVWNLAGLAEAEQGSFPVRSARCDIGRHGADPVGDCVWAVVDYLGEFSIGIPAAEGPPDDVPVDAASPSPDEPAPDDTPAIRPDADVASPADSDPEPRPNSGGPDSAAPEELVPPAPVGLCGIGMISPTALCCILGVTRLRHRRRKTTCPQPPRRPYSYVAALTSTNVSTLRRSPITSQVASTEQASPCTG
ncbi:MAG: immunoglobulin domain-containing protein [Phycisphaerae bacterium]|nr:immunoglobulin domain-containing protein [Phycisphaerae bacterium]